MRTRTEERTPFPWAVKEPLLKETGGKCAHCGTALDRYTNLSVDHFIPLSKGGTNDPENLTVLCDGCNDEKSDMVLFPEWYPFLPSSRRKALTELLIRYMNETDYLAPDCLMPFDTVKIEVPVEARRRQPNGLVKVIRMPAIVQGTRMTNEDAFAWLMEYKKSLQYRDACGAMRSPSEFWAPCYMMKKGDIEIAMANPWMIHEWNDDLKNYRNEIFMDWYFSPSLPDKEYIPEMLAYMVGGLEAYIGKSLATGMEGACAILAHIRCFVSDRFGAAALDRLTRDRDDIITEYDTGYALPARIRSLTAFHVIGRRKACEELKKRLDDGTGDKKTDMYRAMQENDTLNRRLGSEKPEKKG